MRQRSEGPGEQPECRVCNLEMVVRGQAGEPRERLLRVTDPARAN